MKYVAWLFLIATHAAQGDEALIAVAANFVPAANLLADEFEAVAPHTVTISSGSTGKLYAQIVNGAPYDAFLSADEETARRLESSGLAVRDSRFTYAVGRLVVWSADPAKILDGWQATLEQAGIRRLAIANPALAPYGRAAREALRNTGLWDAIADRLVLGENVAQALTLAVTANADVGLVALSQALSQNLDGQGGFIPVPGTLHEPIRQDGVLLIRGADNPAAIAFLAFLRSDEARGRIVALGYGTE